MAQNMDRQALLDAYRRTMMQSSKLQGLAQHAIAERIRRESEPSFLSRVGQVALSGGLGFLASGGNPLGALVGGAAGLFGGAQGPGLAVGAGMLSNYPGVQDNWRNLFKQRYTGGMFGAGF